MQGETAIYRRTNLSWFGPRSVDRVLLTSESNTMGRSVDNEEVDGN